jgi:hypothetical protein
VMPSRSARAFAFPANSIARSVFMETEFSTLNA